MKRLCVLALVLLVAAGGLFAAGTTEEGAAEQRSVRIWVNQEPPEIALDDTPTGQALEEALGVNVVWEYTIGDEAQRAGIILASGEYPDAVAAGRPSMEAFVDAGVFTDLSDYIRNSPALQRAYDPGYIDAHFVREDGVVPFLSNGQPQPANLGFPGGGWFIQQEVLEWAGYPRKFTWEEYVQTLVDYAEEFPQINGQKTLAYIFQNDGWKFDTLSNPPAELDGYVDGGGFWFDKKGGKWVPQIISGTDNEKRFLTSLNQLYIKGLLDEESFVQSEDQYKAKLASGRVLGGYGYRYQLNPVERALREQEMPMRRWVAIPVAFEEDIVPPHRISAAQGIFAGFMIMPDTDDPDFVWDVFVERWLSDDAVTARWWKVPGETFSIAEDGTYYMTEEQMKNWYAMSDEDRYDLGIVTGGRHLPYFSGFERLQNGSYPRPEWHPEIAGYKFVSTAENRAYLDAYDIDAPGELWTQKTMPGHGWTWSISREDDAGIAYEQWDEFRRRWVPRLVLADKGEFDSVWSDYLEAFEDVDIGPWMERAEYVGNYRSENNNPTANP
jgi:putative aldouronate transport system substrate-binding protein